MATLRTKKEQLCAFDKFLVRAAAHGCDGTAQHEAIEDVYNHYTSEEYTLDVNEAIREVEAIKKACDAVLKTLKKDTIECEDEGEEDLGNAAIIYDHGEDDKDDAKKRKKDT